MTIFGLGAALLCLAVLIFWHELGHFIFARLCGVHVERFSVGFGKPLLLWRDKKGTEYCLAAIPFGGYVRMYGEDIPVQGAGNTAPANAKSFNSATIWQKLLIVLAGPAFNILLTWLVLSLLNLQGITQLYPYIETPSANSQAEIAGLQRGDLITAVDSISVENWQDVELSLINRIGDTGYIKLSLLRENENLTANLAITNWLKSKHQPHPTADLGLSLWQPHIPAKINQVIEGQAAKQAGFQTDDLVISINGQSITNWQGFVSLVQASPEQQLNVLVQRGNTLHNLQLTPGAKINEANNSTIGYAGVSVAPVQYPQDKMTTYKPGLLESFVLGVENSIKIIRLIGVSLAKLISGDIAFSNLSGPIGIIKYANDSAESGLANLLAFVAYMSMSLGLLNLLPLPILDGGQAILIAGEGITGKPLGQWWHNMLMRISMALLLTLMVITTFNDITSL